NEREMGEVPATPAGRASRKSRQRLPTRRRRLPFQRTLLRPIQRGRLRQSEPVRGESARGGPGPLTKRRMGPPRPPVAGGRVRRCRRQTYLPARTRKRRAPRSAPIPLRSQSPRQAQRYERLCSRQPPEEAG